MSEGTTHGPEIPLANLQSLFDGLRRPADALSNNEQTVRVLADYEVRLLRVRLSPLLILLFSVAPILPRR